MTGRTHDLAAFTLLNLAFATSPLQDISFATAIVAVGANFIGGLTPDIDQPTGELWGRIPAGSIISRLITPMLGSHRLISHSLLGIILFGIGTKYLLQAISSVLLVNMNIVWIAFMLGFISHLLADTFTKDGVYWLFPLPVKIGIPPFRFMRVTTGGIIEKSFIFPGLIILNGYIIYISYAKYLDFFRNYIK